MKIESHHTVRVAEEIGHKEDKMLFLTGLHP
jgi:hypothetical protein